MRRKYLSLGLGELAAALTFAAVAVFQATPRLVSWNAAAALWAVLTPLLIILVQAGVYWLLARRWVASTTSMPPAIASAYRGLKVANVVLLAVGLLGMLTWSPNGSFLLAVGAVWLFAGVEYVNYFVVRVAYPVRRWPSAVRQRRSPQLVQDIAASRREPKASADAWPGGESGPE